MEVFREFTRRVNSGGSKRRKVRSLVPTAEAVGYLLPPLTGLFSSQKVGLRLRYKYMAYLDRITFNSEQCGGRPCIRGMRIRVKDVLDMLAAGSSEKEILGDYPDLETQDIRACLEFAASEMDHTILKVG